MKIIDLLNKIAKDELEDTKFEYDGDCFKYYRINQQIDRYEDDTYTTVEYYNDSLFNCNNLNDEVEIIEEEKEIRKLPNEIQHPRNFEEVVYIAEDLVRKINQIIDVINDMRDKE